MNMALTIATSEIGDMNLEDALDFSDIEDKMAELTDGTDQLEKGAGDIQAVFNPVDKEPAPSFTFAAALFNSFAPLFKLFAPPSSCLAAVFTLCVPLYNFFAPLSAVRTGKVIDYDDSSIVIGYGAPGFKDHLIAKAGKAEELMKDIDIPESFTITGSQI